MRRNKWIISLFLVGFLIFIYPHVAQYVNSHLQKAQAEQFKESTKSLTRKFIEEKIFDYEKCNDAIYQNEDSLHDPFTEGFRQDVISECENIDSNNKEYMDDDYFSVLEIPKLNIEIPIFLGSTESELSRGIGQVEGSSLPIGGTSTHTVLAGHRGMGTKAMFRNLDRVQKNDVFYIHTLKEKIAYQVYDIKIILPHETESLAIKDGADLASLITCHPYPTDTHRLVVYGERIN